MVKPVMARTSADLPEAHVPIAAGVALMPGAHQATAGFH